MSSLTPLCALPGPTGTIIGPADTAYAEGQFQLAIDFPSDYPFKPMNIRFKTKIFHPNVNSSGELCLEMLKNSWSPAQKPEIPYISPVLDIPVSTEY